MELPNVALQALASGPRDEQIHQLSYAAENTEVCQAEVDAMIFAWRSRSQATFEKLYQERLLQLPQTFNKLIVQRNQSWMPQLTAMVNDDIATLVVVGVLHFVGDFGLPTLLGQAGMVVSRAD